MFRHPKFPVWIRLMGVKPRDPTHVAILRKQIGTIRHEQR
jgi:hypothetical protein